MLHRPYGRTGKELSVIGFGGMRFENPQDIDANAEVVLHAYERGVNYFDTAPHYCQDKSEDIFAAAMRHMDRDAFYVSTKAMSADGDRVRESLEQSLRRLGVEKIDFFHIWCVLTLEAWEKRKRGGAVQAAHRAKEEGLVEHVVMSSHMPGDDICQVLEEGLIEGVTLGYCALNFPYRQTALDTAGRLGLGVVTMNPLGGGLIPRNAGRFDFLRGPDDPSVVAAALRFNISQPAVTCALVGCTTKQHVDEAVDAAEGFEPYSAEHVDRLRINVQEEFDDLCTGCGYCLPCPEGVPIPKLMDAYNMKLLAGGPEPITDRLHGHWGIGPDEAQACSQCGTCEQRCTQHLPIRERMQEIAALAEQKTRQDA